MKIGSINLRKLSLLAGLLGMAGLAGAEETAIPIYQLGDTQGTFIQVSLSQDMYRDNMLRPDLKNLLVLDAEQNPLPYSVTQLKPIPPPIAQPIVSDELLFFPIPVDATPDSLRKLHSEKLQMEAGAVQVITSDKILNNNTPEFYLLDISKLTYAISGISIDWDAQAGNQYLELELEGTDNLQDWASLGRSTLVQITQPQRSMKKNRIEVAIAKNKYTFLRLRVVRGAEGLQLSKVTAEHEPETAPAISATKERWSLNGELAKEQTELGPQSQRKSLAVTAWEFSRSEATPVETVAIDFAQAVYAGSGKILSRSGENKNWELQYQGIFYNAQIGSQWQSTDPVKVYSKSAKYWRIELNGSARDKVQPKLVFAWQPVALQIIVNDKPPFTLAIGAADNSSHSRQVFNQLAMPTSSVWQPSTLIALDVKPQAIAPAQRKIDSNQYLFWTALLLAVLVLLFFSWRLFKQIDSAPEQ